MSATHLVVIPSYNTGPRLKGTVLDALEHWKHVWVVVDGSDDGSDLVLDELTDLHSGFRVIRKSKNGGKGSGVLHAAEMALESGFTHALVMDADGQHPGDSIEPLMLMSQQDGNTVVMGQPIFGPEVPKARLYGRRLTIFWTELETLYAGLGDTLFGMRVYPLAPLCKVMHATGFARGYDFDPEVAVRLVWEGVRPVQLPVPVRYFTEEEDGVSHFHYLRDNVKLTALHFRLMFLFICYGACRVLRFKKRWNRAPVSSTQS
ncbi:MAG: glycosyltransferase family 2 protein [Opitutaceae bacterium]